MIVRTALRRPQLMLLAGVGALVGTALTTALALGALVAGALVAGAPAGSAQLGSAPVGDAPVGSARVADAPHAGGPSAPAVLAGWAALAVLGALGASVATGAEPWLTARRRVRGDLAAVAAHGAVLAVDGVGVTLVADPRPVALAGRARCGACVVVSTGLADRLDGAQLRAVVAHERAHLALRHSWLTGATALAVRCAPGRPARRLDRSVRLLVELAADDRATRRVGAAALADALEAVARLTDDPGAAERAHRLRVIVAHR